MAKKLTPDYIELVAKFNATEAQHEINKLTEATKALQEEKKNLKKVQQELVLQGKKNSEEYRNLTKAINSCNSEINNNSQKMDVLEGKLDKASMSTAQLEKMQKKLRKALKDTVESLNPEEYGRLKKELSAVDKQIKINMSGVKGLKERFLEFIKTKPTITGFFVAIGVAIGKLFVNNIGKIHKTLEDFEYANASLAATMGKSRKEIKALTDDAKRLGESTSYSASQVSNLQLELAKLGFSEREILDMTESVLLFANATGAELSDAASLSGAALRAFNLDASESERVTSAMAVATTKSALDFSYLETSMSTVAPVAKAFGFSIEETLSLLGTLANSGFDASTAATATRNIILKLSDSSGELAKSLGGPIKSLDDLAPALKKLKAEGIDLAKALELTDVRSVAAFNTFVDGSDKLVELRDAVTDAGDAMQAMADEKMNTSRGSTELFVSALEGLILKFSFMLDVFRAGIDVATFFVSSISWLIDTYNSLGVAAKTVLNTLGTYIIATKTLVALKIADGKTTIANFIVEKSHLAITKAQVLWTNAATLALSAKEKVIGVLTGKIALAKVATAAWNFVLNMNPFVAIASAIVGAVTLVASFASKTEEATEAQKEFNDIEKEANEAIKDKRARIERLTSIINDHTLSQEARIAALKELKSLIPDLQEEMSKEGDIIIKNTKAIDDYLTKLKDVHKQKKLEEKLSDISVEEDEINEKIKDKSLSSKEREKLNKRLDQIKTDKKVYTDLYKNVFAKNADRQKKADEIKESQKGYLEKLEDERKAIEERKAETEEEQRKKNRDLEAKNEEIRRAREIGTKAYAKSQKEKRLKALKEKEEQEKKAAEEAARAAEEADKTAIKKAQDNKKKSLDDLEDLGLKQRAIYEQQYADGVISKEKYAALMSSWEAQEGEKRLEIAKTYEKEIKDIKFNNEETKEKTISQASTDVSKLNLDAMRKKAIFVETLRNTVFDFKDEFKLNSVQEELNLELVALESFYQAKLEIIKEGVAKELITKEEGAEKEKELHALLQQAKLQLEKDFHSKKFSILENYGLISFKEHLEKELEELKVHKEKGLLTEEEYSRALGTIRFSAWNKQFEQYSQMFSDAVEALRSAEIANMEAKYDAEIQSAEGNAERVEQLEQEKAEKKLEIEKKYADVQFAIKAAQIASNTALAIIETHASLGGWTPWAIAAAALMGITGAAQLAVANSEREKVKNMTISGSSKSNSKLTGERVLNNSSGYSEGGYTGDGERLEVAGAVHRGEYVVPMPEMKDRRVINMVKAIESIRRQRTSLNPLPGYSEGGYVSGKTKIMDSTTNNGSNDLTQAATALRTAASTLTEKPIRTYVLLSDVNSAYELKNRSEQPFTRGK
ncbi:MAG: phage tail tape measure protein [Bacteroides sp.]|nr:phage tail tape measure protein [Bacteroides sp.]